MEVWGAEGNEGQISLNAFVCFLFKLVMVPCSIYHEYLQWDDTKSSCCWFASFTIVYDSRNFRSNTVLKHKSRQMVKPGDLQNRTGLLTRNVQYKCTVT